jgi:hypothetical protein
MQMAKFTLEELYYGDKYNIMGSAAAEMLRRGACEDEQTQVELCLVKHALLVARRMTEEGDEVVGI